MSHLAHPGRSVEFLSRLHDEELSAAERAHFESHRAHCAECRKAAAEFEDALAFYRTSGTSPASGDLAARILRRLETANPRRSPFGVVFGIDLKWAGVFTAALIAMILGYSVLDRSEQRSGNIRVSFARPAPGTPAAAAAPSLPALIASRSETAMEVRSEPRRDAKSRSASKGTGNLAAPPPPLAPRDTAAKPASPTADRLASARTAREEEDAASAPTRSSLKTLSRAVAASPIQAEAPAVAPPTPSPVRVTVTALDGYGDPPELLQGASALGAVNRGDWILMVGANGVPIEAAPAPAARMDANAGVSREKASAETLGRLRFQVGGRPRRLLVRVE